MRQITETQSPDNIVCFRAESYAGAVEKAAEGLEEPKIQGCVWLRDDFERAHMPSPKDMFALLKREIESGNDYLSRLNPVFNSDHKHWYKLGVKLRPSGNIYHPDCDLMRSLMHPEIGGLLKHFSSCYMTIRFATQARSSIHMDPTRGDGNALTNMFKRGAFNGCEVRMIEYEGDVPGTLIYDPQDIDLVEYAQWLNDKDDDLYAFADCDPEPWMVRPSDALFLTNSNWPKQKILLHAEPEFEVPSMGEARVIRVFDCMPKKLI